MILLRYSAAAKRNKFLKRIVKFRLMDFQFAFWQMIYLLIAPQKVFRDFQYRKRELLISFELCVYCFLLNF